jgi:hypothetical protein
MEANNAQREALANLVDVIDRHDSGSPLWWHDGAKGVIPLKNAKAALAEPIRNCEVGTAMEQGERFSAYCRAHKHPESECLLCPLFGQTGGHCELAWAQLPYEVQEGGAK